LIELGYQELFLLDGMDEVDFALVLDVDLVGYLVVIHRLVWVVKRQEP
jgi:hypothetical protein|tara:strand:+ start:190 stop:333 length:144 start_codon:yes stop_codon:yes gene_type:complete